MSAAVTSATCARTFPYGNLAGTCHSVKVLRDSKVKHTSQRYHEPLNSVFATNEQIYIKQLLYILLAQRFLSYDIQLQLSCEYLSQIRDLLTYCYHHRVS